MMIEQSLAQYHDVYEYYIGERQKRFGKLSYVYSKLNFYLIKVPSSIKPCLKLFG